MDITITNPATDKKYKITPYNNGECFQIYQTSNLKKGEKAKNGKELKNEWQFTGKYPSSIPDALRLVSNMIMLDPDWSDDTYIDTTEIDQIEKKIIKTIKDAFNTIQVS